MKITIITVTLNNRDYLEQTIRSVIDQSYSDKEYIVIDGGSLDGSKGLIESYAAHIDYWVSERDNGIYHAMNKAIAVATGDYCLFLNAGDVFVDSSVLDRAKPLLNADFVYGSAYVVEADQTKSLWKGPLQVNPLFFMQRFSICHQSVFTKTHILKARPYNEAYRLVADYEQMFYELIINKRTFRRLEMVIADFRRDGVSADDKKADLEKQKVLEAFRYFNYIEHDELFQRVNQLKMGTKKYALALFCLRIIVDGAKTVAPIWSKLRS
ncbi:glycosyltransferase family 2 protein [Sphingobacterium deserti]|uniref:Putative colanic acid biosynthesis glycosyltransferase n=1 Tax=Sphingobacterium deserti TaxID=1229276 RepID=A0A0B8T0W6_9SPHI|nr:glycosyltransferase family 2 protein [Sphingobacterium deserti]KGE14151.1 putative colanic acid biosynthesis glycosyltransferase [Sphingobacterium deserti]